MEIGINDLKVNKRYEFRCTSFAYLPGDISWVKLKLNAFGSPMISYISNDYVLCSAANEFYFIILNPIINDKY